MMILQIFIGLFAALDVGCILADIMKVPTMKAYTDHWSEYAAYFVYNLPREIKQSNR